ncbi:TPA: winged helix-turn-helix transcriptional regulator [Thermoplasmata archaeon]|nr:winged helix-turn-helix transcriptional regulator [Thermoplasmata archaeon]
MGKWTKVVAAVFAVAAIVFLGYAIFSQQPDEDVTTPGMGDRNVYSSSDLAIIVVCSFVIAVAVMFIFLREEYEPLPPSMKSYLPPPPPKESPAVDVEPAPPVVAADEPMETEAVVSLEAPEPGDVEAEKKRETYLVLRLLTGDERTMFRTIMDAGGEALQKDLIQRTKMSNAKVSRVLDRLVEKGVISKERHGSTNKVRIAFDFE